MGKEIKIKSCVYCGDFATDRDHIVPISHTSIVRSYKKGETVPCCKNCNSILSNKMYTSIDTRAMYVLGELTNKKKYKKILKTPKWSEADLCEMGDGMRQFVKSSQFEADLLRERIRNLEAVSMGYSAMPINSM